ncbi:MAG: DNA repair protein RadC [Deltaproteobacteria bacterium]|nr:DNA repair protein RadC [Deltaproteobacteria bacterium]MDQ3299887.1 DNA repair protein RadC [Myxococcota bacterium]
MDDAAIDRVIDDALPIPGERPRERVWRRGTATVGDHELLSMILGSGVRDHPALAVASELVRSAGGVAGLSRASPRELAQITGVGTARATRVAAAFELGRRAIEQVHHRETIGRPEDVYRVVAPRVAGLPQEVFLVIGVDIRNGLLDIVEVARGSVAGVEVHPREVFRPLIRMAAAGGVLVHNHPSGDPTPSHEDIELTRRLRDVGTLLGIPIIDHIVIGDRSFRSVGEWLGTDL